MSNGMGFQEQHSNHNANNAATMMRGNVSMTQKQIETLRIQIAAYETLSEQLAEKYRAHRAARQAPPQECVRVVSVKSLLHWSEAVVTNILKQMGVVFSVTSEVVKPVNMYGGDTSRGIFNMKPRWSPTTEQLQIMEKIFKQVTPNPDRKMINEITAELANHGNISEKNVCNWFQNKRARSKKKQPNAVIANNVNTNGRLTSGDSRYQMK
ncbi:putative WUSCHEL-related homeobox 10 [Gastrolobium bilobum]|uniref:putative WUSCHEL-related homeobox 10 n=1 Tax=Gastrolobium bilobum TaxID=150636 RepID=UPI002AAF50EE|nr:putative WUSCHEL-related homeobox 10 [Gastrolobium bilobum]